MTHCWRYILRSVSLLALLVLASRAMAASPSQFQVLSYDAMADGFVELPGRLYVPTGVPAGEKRPLVLYFHGSSEQGSNNSSQVNANIDGLLENAIDRKFYLYAPQLSNTFSTWNDMLDVAMGMIVQASRTHAIDTSRLYVTGISMGGGVSRVSISSYRDVLAAAAPLSSVSYPEEEPTVLAGKPIWMFHSANDPAAPVSMSDDFVNAIRAADGGKPPLTFPLASSSPGSPYPYTYTYVTPSTQVNAGYCADNNLRYSRYTAGGHATKEWTKYYREPWLYDWMLEQTNPQRQLRPGESVLFDLGDVTLTRKDARGRAWNHTRANEERTEGVAVPFALLADDPDRSRSGVSLTVTDTFAGRASRGLTAAGSAYDPAIAQDTWTVTNLDPAALMLEGLTPGGAYSLRIFGSDSDSDAGNGRMTRYTVGPAYRELELYNNLSETAFFEQVSADAFGRITLVISVAPGTDARFGGIGAIELMAVPEPTGVTLLAALAPLLLRPRRCRRCHHAHQGCRT